MVSIEMSKSSLRSLFSEDTPDDPAAASTVAAEVTELRALLERHNYLYYVEARPEITDREYDVLMARLMELEREHPELRSAEPPHRCQI